MPRIGPIKWKDLIRRLHSFGYDGPYSGGKHLYMICGDRCGDRVVTIPNPHRQEIGVDLLIRILKQANITRKEWERG